MNRVKLVEAILKAYRESSCKEALMRESLKRVGDMDLIVLANEIGIDTDALAQVA